MQVLYELQSVGRVVRSNCNPPTWILATNPLAETAQYLPNSSPINGTHYIDMSLLIFLNAFKKTLNHFKFFFNY